MDNLTLYLLQLAKQHPTKAAIVTPRITLSWSMLSTQIEKFAAHMIKHGVERDSCVALATRNPVLATCCILAVGMIGATWRQAAPEKSADAAAIKDTHLFHTFVQFSMPTKAKVVQIDRQWKAQPYTQHRKKLQTLINNFNPDDIWYLSQSSGTTGRAKWMEISYANYWRRNEKAFLTHDFDPIVTANLFPPLSAPWVSYNMRTLWLGGTLVFGPDVNFFLKHNVQKVFASPHHLNAFLNRQQTQPEQMLPIAHVAGGTISKPLSDSILQWFDLIHNFYGSTEVGGIARNLINRNKGDVNCVGEILTGNKIQIVDDHFRPVAQGESGMIGIQNDIMLNAYTNNAQASANSFRDGWFYPGDTGYLNEAGELYITGRYDDVLNISGAKIDAAAVDKVIQSCPAIKQGICFVDDTEALPRLMALLVIGDNDLNVAMEQLQQSMARELPPAKRILGVYAAKTMPANANGKPLRHKAMHALHGLQPVMFETAPG